MPRDPFSTLGQGLGGFGRALLKVDQMNREQALRRKQQRRQAAQQRFNRRMRMQQFEQTRDQNRRAAENQRFQRALQAVTTPGVSIADGTGPSIPEGAKRLGEFGGQTFVYQTPAEKQETPTYTVPGLNVEMPATDQGFERGVELRRRFYPDQFDRGQQAGSGPSFTDALGDKMSVYQDVYGALKDRYTEEVPAQGMFGPTGDTTERTLMPRGRLSAMADSVMQGQLPFNEALDRDPSREGPRRRNVSAEDFIPRPTREMPGQSEAQTTGRLEGPGREEEGGRIGGPIPSSVAIDLMQRAGSAKAALDSLLTKIDEPTEQEQKVIDILRDHAAGED